MGASGLDGPGVVVGSIVGLVLVAKKRSRNGRRPNHILQVVCGGCKARSAIWVVETNVFAWGVMGGPPITVSPIIFVSTTQTYRPDYATSHTHTIVWKMLTIPGD